MDKKEKQRNASKKWYEKNKELIKEKRKGTRKEEHKNNYQKLKEKKGMEYIRQKSKIYREKYPEKVKQTLANYRKKHPERKLLYGARNRAKKVGLDFDIEESDIIIPEYCPLLGIKLELLGQCDNSPSLDRIDNSKGYIKGNVWVISFKANRMKNTATLDELIVFANNVNKLMLK